MGFWYGCNFFFVIVCSFFLFLRYIFGLRSSSLHPKLPKNLSSFSVCPCRHSLKIESKFGFCHFWFRRLNTHLPSLPLPDSLSLVSFSREGELQYRHRPHAASSPSVWIDKDFWFQSSPFSPPSPCFASSPPSLLSFILCIFGIERPGERERVNANTKNWKKGLRERERDNFG